MSDSLQSSHSITDWYRPGKSIKEFHASKARMRCLIGGRGTGKTTAVCVESIGHCMWNAGARVMILRKTQDSNDETTLKTFEEVFEQCGMVEDEASLFKKIEGGRKFRVPSLLATQRYNDFLKTGNRTKSEKLQWIKAVGERLCGEIGFAGIPTAQFRATRLRGYECSLLIFVEADQLDDQDLKFGEACLRWKGADPKTCDEKGFIRDMSIILDTNPPGTTHWISTLEKKKCADTDLERRRKWNQPGRVDCGPDLTFWHISTAENKHNLPERYVENLEERYADNPSLHERMLMGLYSDAEEGQRVLYSYQVAKHAFVDLPWPKGAYLVRGWDFGSTHCTIWSAYWEQDGDERWWDMLEYFAEQSDTQQQCRAVVEMTNLYFPFWNERHICSGVLDFCDVAGAAKTDKGSSVEVLRSFEIYPGYSRMGLMESIALYNRMLEKKDKDGNYIYRLDKELCPRLHRASAGQYRYPGVGEVGHASGQPLKGVHGGNADHVVDAARYGKINCMRLLKASEEEKAKAVGHLARPIKVNPPRRWR